MTIALAAGSVRLKSEFGGKGLRSAGPVAGWDVVGRLQRSLQIGFAWVCLRIATQ